MKSGYFGMDGKPITLAQMGRMEKENPYWRIVAQSDAGKKWVSTVLLCSDHNFSDRGLPIIFETMVFPGNECVRYRTLSDAKAGHLRMVRLLKRRMAAATRKKKMAAAARKKKK
jgi:hypothetical protein